TLFDSHRVLSVDARYFSTADLIPEERVQAAPGNSGVHILKVVAAQCLEGFVDDLLPLVLAGFRVGDEAERGYEQSPDGDRKQFQAQAPDRTGLESGAEPSTSRPWMEP